MKKALFVFHAKAGRGSLGPHLLSIIQTLNQADYAVTVMTTRYSGHATELVKAYAEEFDLLITSGGDGTVNEIVNGVIGLKKHIPIAYIPTGTTNDVAASLGIPKDVEECLAGILNGETFTEDCGMLNGKAFVYVAAFGTPVKVTYTTPQAEKNVWGYAAYVAALLKELPRTRSYRLKITNGEDFFEGDYMFGFITNSFSMSGIRDIMGKNVSLNDGEFEVMLIPSFRPIELSVVLQNILSDHPNPKYVQRFKTKHLTVASEEPLEWCVDGEFGGKLTLSDISVLRDAVTFIV